MAILSFLSKIKDRKPKERDEYHARIVRHRLVFLYKILICVGIVAAFCISMYISYINKEYTGYEIISEEERADSDDAVYIPYNGNILKYSQDGAEAFDGNNVALWNATFEMQSPQVATCEGYAALGDFKGTKIYTISETGETGEIETKLPVSSFCISSQGVVAAVLEDDNETKINIYNAKGEILASMKCTMTKSGYPIDVSLSNDGLKLGVSYVRIENGQLKSSVAFYNFGEVGQNEIDNYVSGYDYVDSVVPKIQFINNETAFSIGDNRFVIYRGSQKPTSYFEMFLNEEVQSVFFGEKNIALVFRNTNVESDAQYRVDIYSEEGQLILSQSIDMDYTDISLCEDKMIVYNDVECQMYKLNGKIKYSGTFEDPMLLLVPQKNISKWTLVNRDSVQSVKLK